MRRRLFLPVCPVNHNLTLKYFPKKEKVFAKKKLKKKKKRKKQNKIKPEIARNDNACRASSTLVEPDKLDIKGRLCGFLIIMHY